MNVQTILLIGANGQLGTDIARVLVGNKKYRLIPLTHTDIEVSDRSRVKEVIHTFRPDIIINTAAYHNVEEAEDNAQKAFEVNCIALQYLSQFCNELNTTLVFISTDYVFGIDEAKKTPYNERDCPGPVNMYGVSKLAGEYVIQQNCSRYFILRTSGLFGRSGPSGKGGKNFVETMISLAQQNRTIRAVDDQVASPTYTVDLARQIIVFLETDAYGLYHASASGSCSWYEFARQIFSYIGMDVHIEAVDSSVFPTKAKRPKYSALDNYKLRKNKLSVMRHWTEGLRDYLIEKSYIDTRAHRAINSRYLKK